MFHAVTFNKHTTTNNGRPVPLVLSTGFRVGCGGGVVRALRSRICATACSLGADGEQCVDAFGPRLGHAAHLVWAAKAYSIVFAVVGCVF